MLHYNIEISVSALGSLQPEPPSSLPYLGNKRLLED